MEMNQERVHKPAYTHFRKFLENPNSKPVGDLVVIKMIVEEDVVKTGSIFIPDSASSNCELITGKVLQIGADALHFGYTVGDVVVFDRFSVYAFAPKEHGVPVITHGENVIGVLS